MVAEVKHYQLLLLLLVRLLINYHTATALFRVSEQLPIEKVIGAEQTGKYKLAILGSSEKFYDDIFDKEDRNRTIRAFMIRKFLEKYTSVTNITIGVLIYLLHVKLQHGIRSLEKIIKNSENRSSSSFDIEHLPPPQTLKLHVKNEQEDVKKFIEHFKSVEEYCHVPLHLEWRKPRLYKITESCKEYLKENLLDKEKEDIEKIKDIKNNKGLDRKKFFKFIERKFTQLNLNGIEKTYILHLCSETV